MFLIRQVFCIKFKYPLILQDLFTNWCIILCHMVISIVLQCGNLKSCILKLETLFLV
jgi:hypothetical protein